MAEPRPPGWPGNLARPDAVIDERDSSLAVCRNSSDCLADERPQSQKSLPLKLSLWVLSVIT
jgi:hypothetical protein